MTTTHLPSPIGFREDINGLRTWAILAVLGFHFPLIALSGGFTGVDIFFVISGYLMTAIIMKGLAHQQFSLGTFYLARIRRILPALLVLITTLLCLGWFWLPDIDYQSLAKVSLSGLTFTANLHYWLSTGYFEAAAHDEWLLHTWSLAVEAQFYLLFPVFILLSKRYLHSLRTLTIWFILLWGASFGLSLVMGQIKPTASFYLLPTRGWELLSGALVYLWSQQYRLTSAQTSRLWWLGWLLIFVTLFTVDESMAWPSAWTLLPVLGASFIIMANQRSPWLTHNAVMQWLGDRSYSLYLWHWPLVTALYFSEQQQHWPWVVAALVSSFILAHLSYTWVEIPTRRYLSRKSFRREIQLIAGVQILLISFATLIYLQVTHLTNRLPSEINLIMNESRNQNPYKTQCHDKANQQGTPGCQFGDGALGAILWGDSHANAVSSALALSAQNSGKSIIEWSFSGCPALFGADSTPWRNNRASFQCRTSSEWVAKQLDSQYPNVPLVIVTRTSHYLYGQQANESRNPSQQSPLIYFSTPIRQANDPALQQAFRQAIIDTSCALAKHRPVFILRPIPEMQESVPQTLSRRRLLGTGNEDIRIALADYHARHQLVWQAEDSAAQQCGIQLLDPLPYLCDQKNCYGSQDGHPLYFDDDHLSESGNRRLAPLFNRVFQ